MKRLIVLILLVLILVFSIFYLSRNENTSSLLTTDNATSNEARVEPDIPLSISSGFSAYVFADKLNSPRDLSFSPKGTLLVSEPNSNRIVALPDNDNNQAADESKVVIEGLNHPHGISFYNGKLFIAEVNRVSRYNWDEENLTATFDKELFPLPRNNNHVNRTITFDESGTMYVSVGSTCNVCVEQSDLSATVVISNSEGENPRVFADGLRNPAFSTINPETGELWATGMGRDFLGDNLPPDEINIIKEGENYGWPYCYGDRIHDSDFDPDNSENCEDTQPPVFEIPAHSAPLGLTFIDSAQFPNDWQNDLLVSYHGSWNRSTPTGYKVVRMHTEGDEISQVSDFITGFLRNGETLGRPVDLIFDNQGNLFISDDYAGNVYILKKN